MNYFSDIVRRAILLAIDAHKGQTDKAGQDYINHPVQVALTLARNGCSDQAIATGLLHDVIEDTHYTIADLIELGFPTEVTDALTLLTHDPTEPYFDYVHRIAKNPIARQVKNADLLHNLDSNRIPCPTEKDLARWDKYRTALKILSEE